MAVPRDWTEKVKYQRCVTDNLYYINFVFYIFEPVLQQEDIFLLVERTRI